MCCRLAKRNEMLERLVYFTPTEKLLSLSSVSYLKGIFPYFFCNFFSRYFHLHLISCGIILINHAVGAVAMFAEANVYGLPRKLTLKALATKLFLQFYILM